MSFAKSIDIMAETTTNNPTGTMAGVTAINEKSYATKVGSMPKLTMGTWEETYNGSGVFNALVGGRPKPDWSGLDEDQPFRAVQGSHYRPIDPIKRVKGAAYRTAGLQMKFSKGHSISKFQKDVWNHLLTHGLDTIAYLKDPFTSSVMINVVEHHPRFCHNHENAVILSKEGQKNFDQWDKENDANARQFLINSLDDDILEGIKHHIQPEFSFTTVWLYLIHHIITTSSARFDDIKSTIRSMSPLQYEAQNITLLANDYIDKFKELESGGQMDYNLITSVLQSFHSADGPEIYKFALLNLETKADTAINTVAFMSSEQKDTYMRNQKLDIQSICNVATAGYRKARDNNQWGPLKQVRNRRGVPHASLVTLLDGSTAYALTPAGKREIICWNCGEKGHAKRDCTKPDSNNKFKPDGPGFKDHNHSKKTTKKEDNWNLVAPKKGDSETKRVEGCTWKYCAKCGYWNSSHTTAEHDVTKNKGSNNNSSSDQEETDLSDQDKKEINALLAGTPFLGSAIYNISICEPAKEGSDKQHALFNDDVSDHDSFDVVWDSGASLSVTNNKRDFVSFKPLCMAVATVGQQSDTKTSGIGMVKYDIINTNGELQAITSKAFYIPTAKQKLLSVADVLSNLPGGKFYMSASCTVLEAPSVGKLEIKNNQVTNLPTSQVFCPQATSMMKQENNDYIQLEGATNYLADPSAAKGGDDQHRVNRYSFRFQRFLCGSISLLRLWYHKYLSKFLFLSSGDHQLEGAGSVTSVSLLNKINYAATRGKNAMQ